MSELQQKNETAHPFASRQLIRMRRVEPNHRRNERRIEPNKRAIEHRSHGMTHEHEWTLQLRSLEEAVQFLRNLRGITQTITIVAPAQPGAIIGDDAAEFCQRRREPSPACRHHGQASLEDDRWPG